MKDNLVATERILKSLGNRRRLAIIRYLKGQKEAVVGDIATEIKLSFKATSKHLAILTTADILEREQKGLYMLYRISGTQSAIARTLFSIL